MPEYPITYKKQIEQIALLRSKVRRTTFSQELAKMKAELEEKLLNDSKVSKAKNHNSPNI